MKIIFKPHRIISAAILLGACYMAYRVLSADNINLLLLLLNFIIFAIALLATYYSFFPKTIIKIDGDACQVNGITHSKKFNLKNICHFEKKKGFFSMLLGVSQLIFYSKGKTERITILDNPLIDLSKFERLIFSIGRLQ